MNHTYQGRLPRVMQDAASGDVQLLVDDVSPFGPGAVVRLADGQEVVLDDASEKTIYLRAPLAGAHARGEAITPLKPSWTRLSL